ncbi:integrase [Chamaesiphon sp.]|uniref:integrase n=1 Tax=Chamaesiphon sp. TaxID=2814140 RepID=UPI0035945667
MSNRKHPAISIHSTLDGQLEVDWGKEYQGEYNCPRCTVGKLTGLCYEKEYFCKLFLACNHCKKQTYLTCEIKGARRKYLPISIHETLNGTLEVNWESDYKQEYRCPLCPQGLITNYYYSAKSVNKLGVVCNKCKKRINLRCDVPPHSIRYRPDIECPNPLCLQIGHDGQKGWIYEVSNFNARCHFCDITFDSNSAHSNSWVNNQKQNELLPFNFDEDTWDLGHFYNKSPRRINFREIESQWYRVLVKQYLHLLLRTQRFLSDELPSRTLTTLKQFGCIAEQFQIRDCSGISRDIILKFKDSCQENTNHVINNKLGCLKDFFEYLDLDTSYLIRSRDRLKTSKNDPDWLDEVARQAIHQHLFEIPAPIARHYLIQEYTATRPGDACKIAFDCLVQENDRWYIKFYEGKKAQEHRLPATREIRKVVEEQKCWIRQIFGENYSFLFCHFRIIKSKSYPIFSNIKPIPKPPDRSGSSSPMVRIIRMLIEKEDVRDANGLKPHFVGKITRPSKLQEIRAKHGIEAAQLYANHASSNTTFQHYTPPTREQVAAVDLPFQALLMNPSNKFLPWQSLPESLLKNPKAHELDSEIAPRLVVYGHCILNPKIPCPINLYPKCYGCGSFRPSTTKLPLYERQYAGEQQRLTQAQEVGAELATEEAKSTIAAMDKWLPQLRELGYD